MAGSGQTKVDFNESFFDAIMHSAGVESLCRQKAEAVLQEAKATAPVETGAYRDGIEIKVVHHAHRDTYQVVGTDAKTMLVESKRGTLARALKKAGK
ncbi:HK97 gp10 family phage protein [Bifidobacterium mongoliense]|uniref:HK97 gp10 family phage protein n=1 Tax=Bifidobacterium mongoliense TaxID=518643 RepID=UPI0030EBC0F7